MNSNSISNIHALISDNAGENYWFNGCARYVMECLGEADYDYWFFAGVTGDNFTQFYPRKGNCCAVSDYLMGPAYAAWVFDQVGYACEYVSKQELLANQERYLKKIMAQIDRGVPVISLDWGVFVGYENDGDTLLFLTHEWIQPKCVATGGERFFANIPQSETERGHNFHAFDLIFVGEKKREIPLARLYREAITRLPALLTKKTDAYVFGAAAFRAWADDIESGKYDDPAMLEGDAAWWNYTNYVCALATNGSCCFGFLDKARQLNPDFTFLDEIAALYKKLGGMWGGEKPSKGCLEKLGGGFNVNFKTLQKPKKRAKIAAKIRECADVTDEVLRILRASLTPSPHPG